MHAGHRESFSNILDTAKSIKLKLQGSKQRIVSRLKRHNVNTMIVTTANTTSTITATPKLLLLLVLLQLLILLMLRVFGNTLRERRGQC